jgi:hypothetical protein
MAQIVPTKILNACPFPGRLPSLRIGRVNWLTSKGKNPLRMLSGLPH